MNVFVEGHFLDRNYIGCAFCLFAVLRNPNHLETLLQSLQERSTMLRIQVNGEFVRAIFLQRLECFPWAFSGLSVAIHMWETLLQRNQLLYDSRFCRRNTAFLTQTVWTESRSLRWATTSANALVSWQSAGPEFPNGKIQMKFSISSMGEWCGSSLSLEFCHEGVRQLPPWKLSRRARETVQLAQESQLSDYITECRAPFCQLEGRSARLPLLLSYASTL